MAIMKSKVTDPAFVNTRAAKATGALASARKQAAPKAARAAPPAPASAQGLAAAEDMPAKGHETLRQVAAQGADTTGAAFDKTTALMRDNADKAQVRLTISVAGMSALNRDIFDAAVETGAQMVKTAETLQKAQFDLLTRSMDSAVATVKAISEARSANDLIAVQADYVRGTADSLMVETTRLVELAGKMAQDVAQPCQARFTAAWDKMGKSIAV